MSNELAKYNWLTDLYGKQHYPKLVLQIKKDFELCGLSIDISETTSPEDLVHYVFTEVYTLVQYRFDSFMQLLYRIDIAEKLMHSDQVEASETLAEKATLLILKREWQKIVWREQFS